MTSFTTLEDRFVHKVEEDAEFFQYYQTIQAVAEEVTHTRIKGYIFESADLLASQIEGVVDFTDYNAQEECFNFDLTKKEIYLLTSLMFQVYLSRSVAKLKTWEVNWASSDLKTFDPSNARTTFINMYNRICAENQALIEEYKSRDRETGALIGIDYGSYALIDGG